MVTSARFTPSFRRVGHTQPTRELEDLHRGLTWRGVVDHRKIVVTGGLQTCLLLGHTLEGFLANSAVFRMCHWVEWIALPSGQALPEPTGRNDQESYLENAAFQGPFVLLT